MLPTKTGARVARQWHAFNERKEYWSVVITLLAILVYVLAFLWVLNRG